MSIIFDLIVKLFLKIVNNYIIIVVYDRSVDMEKKVKILFKYLFTFILSLFIIMGVDRVEAAETGTRSKRQRIT